MICELYLLIFRAIIRGSREKPSDKVSSVGNGRRPCRIWNKKVQFIFCLTSVEGVVNVEGKGVI